MSDWSRVPRERFKWLVRAAKLRGASVLIGPCEGSTELADEGGRKAIQVDMGADTAKWGRWLLHVAGADTRADIAACE